MNKTAVLLVSFLISLSPTVSSHNQMCATPIWADEFDDLSLDPKKWNVERGDGCDQNLCGWGNNELQWYQADNIEVKQGHLTILATRDSSSTKNHDFTSAKITTKHHFSQRYGRFEARLKLPGQLGTWPAFWMMPENKKETWPIEGEIDIVEQGGRKDSDLHEALGSLHFGKAWPKNSHITHINTRDEKWSEAFHVFSVEWHPNKISWSVDGKEYGTSTPSDLSPNPWPFNDQPFYLVLNLAIGGGLGGNIDDTFSSAKLIADYVRVYQLCP